MSLQSIHLMKLREKESIKHIYQSSCINLLLVIQDLSNMTYIRYLAQTPYCEMCISTIIDEIASIEWDIVPNDGMEEQEDEAEKEEIKNYF